MPNVNSAAASQAARKAKEKRSPDGRRASPGPDVIQSQTEDLIVAAANQRNQGKQGICDAGPNSLPFQQRVLAFYTHPIIAWGVACIIVFNFLINITEKEIDPIGSFYPEVWAAFELTFNIIFLLELLLNMYGQGGPFKPFWSSGWNIFDTVIVSVGVVLMTGADLGPGNKLKLLRAFRIFRLFKRIKSLNKLLVAIGRSVRGVVNAFVIMFIFMCIYAILAVDLFFNFGDLEDGTYTTHDIIAQPDGTNLLLNVSVSTMTGRGMHLFSEYYGTFFRALCTLFQAMTGESWSEAIARPLMFGLQENNAVMSSLFFVSYMLLMQFVLINVVVAVLLFGFVEDDDEPAAAAAGDDSTDVHMLNGEGAPTSASAPSPSAPPSAAAADDMPSDAEQARLEQMLDAILQELGSMKQDVASQSFDIETLKRDLVNAKMQPGGLKVATLSAVMEEAAPPPLRPSSISSHASTPQPSGISSHSSTPPPSTRRRELEAVKVAASRAAR